METTAGPAGDSQQLVDYTPPTIENIEQTIENRQTLENRTPCLQETTVIETTQLDPSILTVQTENLENEQKLSILGFEVVDKPSPPKSPQTLDQTWDLKQTSSLELLSPSPLGFTPFDSRSIDELMTPDEFASDHLAPGLSNINYDIDLSDFSGDNSLAEDAPKPKDPFSPEGLKKFDPFAPQTSTFKETLDKFDEFSLVDTKSSRPSDPFEVIHRNVDPFSPVLTATLPQTQVRDPFSPQQQTSDTNVDPFSPVLTADLPQKQPSDPFSPQQKDSSSILDDNDSPTAACLLPSPLQPQSSKPA